MSMKVGFHSLRLVATAILVCSLAAVPSGSWAAGKEAAKNKEGGGCKVLSGPNKGKTGTYDSEGDCRGTWGSTNCTDTYGNKSFKCIDAAIPSRTVVPAPVTVPPGGGTKQQGTTTKKPGNNQGTVGTFSGVKALTESDCRLDGGTVVKPGDARCGSLGAVYCRKANGEAACINEQ